MMKIIRAINPSSPIIRTSDASIIISLICSFSFLAFYSSILPIASCACGFRSSAFPFQIHAVPCGPLLFIHSLLELYLHDRQWAPTHPASLPKVFFLLAHRQIAQHSIRTSPCYSHQTCTKQQDGHRRMKMFLCELLQVSFFIWVIRTLFAVSDVTLVPVPPPVLVPSLVPCPAADGPTVMFTQVIEIILNFKPHHAYGRLRRQVEQKRSYFPCMSNILWHMLQGRSPIFFPLVQMLVLFTPRL